MHNGVPLVEFTFGEDLGLVRAELLTTNTNSFGTNPAIHMWHADDWSPHLSCERDKGLAVLYVHCTSPQIHLSIHGQPIVRRARSKYGVEI